MTRNKAWDAAWVLALGEERMPDYKLYRLGEGGQIISAPDQFVADGDEAALAQAEKLRDGGRAELWEGRRLIRRLP